MLRDIRAKIVEVGSVSGDIWLEGRIQDGGRYSIAAHSGDIVMAISEGVNATIATRVFSGDLQAGFALPSAEQPSRRQQRFRFGNGSAVVELEAFSGDVRLLRPADFIARLDRVLRDRQEKRANKRPDHEDQRSWQ